MTVFVLGFQWIFWSENGARRRYSARRWRPLCRRGDGFFPAVDVEAAVVPGEKFGDFLGAEVFGLAEGLEEPVAEKFGDRSEALLGHGVKAAFVVEQAVGGEDMEVRVEDEVIAEGVDGRGGGEAAAGQVEARAKGVAQHSVAV